MKKFSLLSVILVTILLLNQTQVFGWSNGGAITGSYLKQIAVPKSQINITDYKLFTLNISNFPEGQGYGLGTHDWILEEAIARVIKAGKDVSWIDLSDARKGSGYPDYHRSALKNYSYDHTWYGVNRTTGESSGTGAYAVGKLYKEILNHIRRGEKKDASKKLGYLSHFLSDLTSPWHITGISPYFNSVKYLSYHNIHVQSEDDLDYLMQATIEHKRASWKSDVTRYRTYFPALFELDNTVTNPSIIRSAWFRGTKTATPMQKSAMSLAQDAAYVVRTKYAKTFIKEWRKAFNKTYKYKSNTYGSYKDKKGGSAVLFKVGPDILNVGAKYLAQIIYNLSDPILSKSGLEMVNYKGISSFKKKYEKKYLTVSFKVKVTGRDKETAPVTASIVTNGKTKTITSNKKYTNDSGYVKWTFKIKRSSKKKLYRYLKISFPTKITDNVYYKKFIVSKYKKKK